MPTYKNVQSSNVEEIRKLIDYNPVTGVFTWKVPRKGRRKGTIAGHLRNDGAVLVIVEGVRYLANRLAWLLVYGYLPDAEVDHKDRNRSNNAISNLRLATHSQNQANRPEQSNNFCRLKGVSKIKCGYRARLNDKHLGCFATAQEAHAAYLAAAETKYGEFAWRPE